tara:strand:- start:952 stop:1392 length:441 start_codon:yes stop_codon:yes gene_type:complete
MGVRLQQCLTIEQEDQVAIDIYNDRPISYYRQVHKENVVDLNKQRAFLSRVLLPEEEYIIIEHRKEYVYTNKARLFNTKTLRQIAATFSATRIYHVLNQYTINTKNVFEEEGWEYNYENIVNEYKERGWKHGLTTIYKDQLRRKQL